MLILNNSLWSLCPPLRRAQPSVTPLLVLAQPRLQGFTHQALSQEVNNLTQDYENKGNGIHPVDVQSKYLDANGNTPETSSKERDVEEGG